MADYIRDYVNVEEFLEYCKQCPNYGTVWSCPPYEFDAGEFWQPYDTFYIMATKINFAPGTTLKESGKIMQEVKGQMSRELYELEERYPEIERVCPVLLDQVPNHQVYYEDKKVAAAVAFADSTFFDMFSYRILEGDRNRLLADPYSAVISQTFARTLFGSESPIGKTIRLSDKTSVTITGLMEDIDRSAIPYKDLICRIERVTEFMVSFGVVPANFRQVESPQVYATVYAWLTGGSQFVNQADVGGVYEGQWIMATSRWVTKVYKPTDPLPRTGY